MNWATAIVLIVLITAIAGVMRHRNEHRSHRSSATNQPSQHEQQLEEEVEQLRDRIQVLERIATDGNSIDARETQRIATEIDALRDKQDSE